MYGVYPKTLQKHMGYFKVVKNISGIKQAQHYSLCHSLPLLKYLASIEICPARAVLLRYKHLMTSGQCLSIHDPFGSIVALLLRKQNDVNCYAIA